MWRAAVAATIALVPTLAIPGATHATTVYYSLSRLRVSETATVVARWNPCQAAITYRINAAVAAISSAGRASAVADTRASVAALSYATGVKFRYLGTTTRTPSGLLWWQHLGDAELVIAWVDQAQSAHRSSLLQRSSTGWLAGTGGWHAWRWGAYGGYKAGAAIVRGFVVLNAAQRKYFSGDFGPGVTRGELLLHELGHVAGLSHVPYSSQTMYPMLIWRSQSRYFSGDMQGLRLVGRSAGCITIPAYVNAPADLPSPAILQFIPLPRELVDWRKVLPTQGQDSGVSSP